MEKNKQTTATGDIMNLINMMLNKNQMQRNIYCMIPFI